MDGVGAWTRVLVVYQDVSALASIVESEIHAWGANLASMRPRIAW